MDVFFCLTFSHINFGIGFQSLFFIMHLPQFNVPGVSPGQAFPQISGYFLWGILKSFLFKIFSEFRDIKKYS